jgi:hypothetical protein
MSTGRFTKVAAPRAEQRRRAKAVQVPDKLPHRSALLESSKVKDPTTRELLVDAICVVHHELMRLHGRSVGGKITGNESGKMAALSSNLRRLLAANGTLVADEEEITFGGAS